MSTSTLSIQLYSLRHLGGLDQQLDAAVRAGFTNVETIGSHLDEPRALKAALTSRGLVAPSGHIGLPALRGELERVADAAAEAGIAQLFMPALPPEERNGDTDAWRRVGAELGEMAVRLKARDISLGYHNHHWELARFSDGSRPLDCLFTGAAGSPLVWQADVAWLARGGDDPKAWLEKYAGLLVSAHVKDQAPAGRNEDEDGWCDVGSGILDWPDLWAFASARGARLMVVEHDNPKDPAGFAARSFSYLQTIR
ncbi:MULTISPECIES: sugar phosphate isomerase/epimerase [unclassified Rhizobium]|jgi:sugar phosphate isomerase/epimerase|uniref:sugar phosphate isomerase/epimerase family protein n=1 Tax=unclassified Rhizobium TaxID=2613769 RepID=UPI0006490FCE|nr:MULTISPECIES: sugar phosphate isomerase/epimerase [unclassified Rhizobium]OJY74471.1 MAG: xylose isomerase [Rhizobium sp. 60-20]RKD67927.1 sugar phosphate isomerase/epimerase [Rhizobium sp. WW_1]